MDSKQHELGNKPSFVDTGEASISVLAGIVGDGERGFLSGTSKTSMRMMGGEAWSCLGGMEGST